MIWGDGLSVGGKGIMPDCPTVLFDSFGTHSFASSWRFDGYIKTIVAIHSHEVVEALNRAEQAAAEGLYAVGFVAYEAASSLNPDLPSVPPLAGLPLVWFALYRGRHSVDAGDRFRLSAVDIKLEPLKGFEQYSGDVERIRNYIANGDCYQVNHTFPLQGVFKGNLQELYSQVGPAQRAPFCAFLDIGRFTVISASPELFFALKDDAITVCPMKGTASRGRWSDEDCSAVEKLRESPKERAENLMIVDLLRNDLGIIAETGSVTVDALFDVETYPTVHQMTSTVSARLRPGTGLTDIFSGLFPCGSVTGAPKRRGMEIISEIENAPRGIYCGAIGFVAPGGEALFSVAIRTMLFDKNSDTLTMGVGSAVTWDSEAFSEYTECLSKAEFLHHQQNEFQLIETMRLENAVYTLLDRHMARLEASAGYFGFTCDPEKIRSELSQIATQKTGLYKVRLLVSSNGGIDLVSDVLTEETAPLRVGISSIQVHSGNCFCYHKTTLRENIDSARSVRSDCDEVLLLNEHGQLTEGSYHTLVVKVADRLVTPPLACGLLPGVLREELLEKGKILEKILYPEDLTHADEVWLINSVRGWRRGVVI